MSSLPLSPVAALLALAAFSMAAVSCTTSNKSKGAGPKLSAAETKQIDEFRAEVEIGRNMAGRLLGYYGIIEDDKIIGYVNQVGNYVASYSDFPERKYMFAILKHESINAFACPGGYVLITMGALRAAKNEAELASILGHEVAHVGRKHMLNTLRSMKEQDLSKAATASQNQEYDAALKVRERARSEETVAGAMVARYLSGTSGAGLNILQAASAGMNLITEKGLGPDLEFEADEYGLKYAIRAGYDPKAFGSYLSRLAKSSDSKVKNLGKTHPSPENRIARIAKELGKMKADDIIGATGEARFDKLRKQFPKYEKD